MHVRKMFSHFTSLQADIVLVTKGQWYLKYRKLFKCFMLS